MTRYDPGKGEDHLNLVFYRDARDNSNRKKKRGQPTLGLAQLRRAPATASLHGNTEMNGESRNIVPVPTKARALAVAQPCVAPKQTLVETYFRKAPEMAIPVAQGPMPSRAGPTIAFTAPEKESSYAWTPVLPRTGPPKLPPMRPGVARFEAVVIPLHPCIAEKKARRLAQEEGSRRLLAQREDSGISKHSTEATRDQDLVTIAAAHKRGRPRDIVVAVVIPPRRRPDNKDSIDNTLSSRATTGSLEVEIVDWTEAPTSIDTAAAAAQQQCLCQSAQRPINNNMQIIDDIVASRSTPTRIPSRRVIHNSLTINSAAAEQAQTKQDPPKAKRARGRPPKSERDPLEAERDLPKAKRGRGRAPKLDSGPLKARRGRPSKPDSDPPKAKRGRPPKSDSDPPKTKRGRPPRFDGGPQKAKRERPSKSACRDNVPVSVQAKASVKAMVQAKSNVKTSAITVDAEAEKRAEGQYEARIRKRGVRIWKPIDIGIPDRVINTWANSLGVPLYAEPRIIPAPFEFSNTDQAIAFLFVTLIDVKRLEPVGDKESMEIYFIPQRLAGAGHAVDSCFTLALMNLVLNNPSVLARCPAGIKSLSKDVFETDHAVEAWRLFDESAVGNIVHALHEEVHILGEWDEREVEPEFDKTPYSIRLKEQHAREVEQDVNEREEEEEGTRQQERIEKGNEGNEKEGRYSTKRPTEDVEQESGAAHITVFLPRNGSVWEIDSMMSEPRKIARIGDRPWQEEVANYLQSLREEIEAVPGGDIATCAIPIFQK